MLIILSPYVCDLRDGGSHGLLARDVVKRELNLPDDGASVTEGHGLLDGGHRG